MSEPVQTSRGSAPGTVPIARSAAAQRILALVCGYPRERRLKQPIVILQANIDDSGKGQHPVFVLAGFVASAERWTAFANDWQTCLDANPPIAYFKMKEAADRRDEFHSSRFPTDEHRNERLRAFMGIIDEHLPLGVACVVNHEDYGAVFKGRGSSR